MDLILARLIISELQYRHYGIPYWWFWHFGSLVLIYRYTRCRVNMQCLKYVTRWWPAWKRRIRDILSMVQVSWNASRKSISGINKISFREEASSLFLLAVMLINLGQIYSKPQKFSSGNKMWKSCSRVKIVQSIFARIKGRVLRPV